MGDGNWLGIDIYLTKLSYGLFTRQHNCLTTFRTNKPTFLQAHNDHIVTARWLMGLFCKTEFPVLVKYLASAWEVHDDDWFLTSCSYAIIHDWSMTIWHVDNDCRPSWTQLCCFAPFIVVICEVVLSQLNSASGRVSGDWSLLGVWSLLSR